MKISCHSDFLDVSMEQTFYLPSIVFLTIFNQKKKEPLFERDIFENLKKNDLIKIKQEIDIIKRKSTKLKIKPHIQIPFKSVIKSHKWFLFKDREKNFYFFLIDRLICEKITFRFYQKIKGRLKNIKKNIQISKQRKYLKFKVNEIFDKVNEMSLKDNVSSYSCFNSTINSDFSLKHTCISFEGKIKDNKLIKKNNQINKNSKIDEKMIFNHKIEINDKIDINDKIVFDKKNLILFEEKNNVVCDEKMTEREDRILYMKILFVFGIGFAVVLWILEIFIADTNVFKAFK